MYKYNPTESRWCCVALVPLATFCWFFVVTSLSEMHQIILMVFQQLLAFSRDSSWWAEPHSFFCEWIKLIQVKLTADILTVKVGFAPKELFLNWSTFLFSLLTFILPLAGNGLEGRLKHLSSLVQVGFKNHKPTGFRISHKYYRQLPIFLDSFHSLLCIEKDKT